MKRMTAEEVAESLDKLSVLYWEKSDRGKLKWNEGAHYGYALAAKDVRAHLVQQWQDEPTEEGEYHVRGIERACLVYREDTEGQPWAVEFLSTDAGTLATEIRWEPLAGRQVCPIGARPR